MVEIFKTNVEAEQQAQEMLGVLSETFPEFKINFDLYDRDKILRVEGNIISPEKIIELLNSNCYCCEILN